MLVGPRKTLTNYLHWPSFSYTRSLRFIIYGWLLFELLNLLWQFIRKQLVLQFYHSCPRDPSWVCQVICMSNKLQYPVEVSAINMWCYKCPFSWLILTIISCPFRVEDRHDSEGMIMIRKGWWWFGRDDNDSEGMMKIGF